MLFQVETTTKSIQPFLTQVSISTPASQQACNDSGTRTPRVKRLPFFRRRPDLSIISRTCPT